jgi:tetratricopeptide (TPR) repeat protein
MKWAALVLVGCAHAAPPHDAARPGGPSAVVRADIERAEQAERARRHDLARAEYERAVADAHDPASQHLARREFAETLETWGEVPEAIAQLQAAVVAKPDDAPSWNDLGILYQKQGDDTRALAALERAKQLAPRHVKPRLALAVVRQCRNDRAGAIAEYRGLLDLDLPDRLREKIQYWVGVLEKSPGPLGCKGIDRPAPAPPS